MRLQLLAAQEREYELIDELLLPLGEAVRVGGIDRGKRNIVDAILLSANLDRPVGTDERFQQQAALHSVFRVAENELSFELELNDCDGFENFGGHVAVFRHAVGHMGRQEIRAGIVAVLLHGKERERADVQTVAVLEHIKVAVFERIAQRVCNARGIAHRRAHPENVVVAPDKVHAVHFHEIVHHHLRGGSAVEHVADDVQLVDGQPGDEIGKRHDEPVGNAGLDHAVDDAFKILAFVGVVFVGVD